MGTNKEVFEAEFYVIMEAMDLAAGREKIIIGCILQMVNIS